MRRSNTNQSSRPPLSRRGEINPHLTSPFSRRGENTLKYIPYDKNLVQRARELRNNPTEAERKFWDDILKSKELQGFTFLRQKPLGHFIVDFYCARLALAIEIDGDVHRAQSISDSERDNFLLQNFGIKVLRYQNSEVLNGPVGVLKNLSAVINPLLAYPLSRKGK
jgi:very-short-patch-repair endonuclease